MASLHGQDHISDISSHSDSDDAVFMDDHVRDKRPPRKVSWPQKVKQHFTRYWKWYLLGLILFLAILLPLLFTVIIPALVQLILNKIDLPLNYAKIEPQSPSTVLVSLRTTFNSPLPAKLGETVFHLFNRGTATFMPFLSIPFPTTKVNGKTEIAITDQLVDVQNSGELVKWFRQYLESNESAIHLKTNRTDLYLGSLHYTPNLDKDIPIPGLKNLQGIGLADLKVNLAATDGENVQANASIPNWGPITLGLGNLTLEVLSGKLSVGNLTARNVLLNPGNNTITCDGSLSLSSIVANIGGFLQAQSVALGRGEIELGLKATMAMLRGERLAYVEEILKDKIFTVSLPIIKLGTALLDGVFSSTGGGYGPQNSVLDAVGSAFGNTTLMDQIKGHWDL